MPNYIFRLLLCCLVLFTCAIHSAPTTASAAAFDEKARSINPRSGLTADAANDPSIYICQNYDWCPPCLYYPLGSDEDDTQLFWMAPAPGGPGPWNDTGNYTVGSWGPSSGVKTLWRDEEGNYSSLYEYPGTGEVDEYWRDNIWTFYAIWDD